MKKRIFRTIGLVLAMLACVGMTTFAAPSPSGSTIITEGFSKWAKVIIQKLPEIYEKIAEEIKTAEKLKEILGDMYNPNMTVLDVVDVTVESFNGGEVTFPIDITFKVKGVTASTKGAILHYNGSEWEKLPTTMGDGTMSATFTSLSPVAFVVDRTTLASGTATSPQTSASGAATAAILGLAALTGACGLKKKDD